MGCAGVIKKFPAPEMDAIFEASGAVESLWRMKTQVRICVYTRSGTRSRRY
jgi:hypothetical protein